MHVKLLRRVDASTVLLVYPSTLGEYRQALDRLGRRTRPAAGHDSSDPDRAECRPEHDCFVVTTAEQRHRWGLSDLSACGRAGVVGEALALDLLRDPASWSAVAGELPACPAAETAPSPGDDEPGDSGLAAVRALVAPGPRVDRVLAALECGVLPGFVCETLRRSLLESLASGKEAVVEEALARAAMAVALPWRTQGPARFEPVHLKQMLDRTDGGLDRVKTCLVEMLAASSRTRGLLTVEVPRRSGEVETEACALVVRPRTPRAPARVPCLAGPGRIGKTSLAVAVAEALGRTLVRVTLDKRNAARLIRGQKEDAPGASFRVCARPG